MTNRTFPTLAALLCLALACGKKEEPPTTAAAPPGLAEPAPTAAAAPPATAPAAAEAAPDEGPSFEGEVDLRISSAKADKAGKKAEPLLRLQVKGKQFRFTMPEGLGAEGAQVDPKGYMVIDGRQKKALVVSDERKQVVVLPFEGLAEQMGKLGAGAAGAAKPGAEPKPAKTPELTKTGKTDTVAGRSCEEWEVTNDDKTKMRVCVAAESTSWLELPTLGLPSEHAWARGLMDGKHLPLRAIAFEASGKEKGRVELVRLEPKPLDDALFAPPAGYKVMDMGEMMRGMADMLGGAAGPHGDMPPGAPGQQAAMPPGMQGKLPPNFQAMMARMRDQMQAMKAAKGAGGAPGANAERAAKTEKLAQPAETTETPKAKAKTKAKVKEAAAEAKTPKPAD